MATKNHIRCREDCNNTKCKECKRLYFQNYYRKKLAKSNQMCGHCSLNLPLTNFRGRRSDGRVDVCFVCEKTHLRCTRCKQIKEHAAFTDDKDLSTGKKSWCKDCSNSYSRKSRKTPEYRAKKRDYRNRPDVREKNLAALKAYFRTPAGKAATKRFKDSPKGQRNAAKRRQALEDISCTLTKEEWEAVVKKQERRCYYCCMEFDEIGEAPTKDHVIPVHDHGEHSSKNIVASCQYCNTSKGKHSWPITRPDGTIIFDELLRRIAAGHRNSGEHTSDPSKNDVIKMACHVLSIADSSPLPLPFPSPSAPETGQAGADDV